MGTVTTASIWLALNERSGAQSGSASLSSARTRGTDLGRVPCSGTSLLSPSPASCPCWNLRLPAAPDLCVSGTRGEL